MSLFVPDYNQEPEGTLVKNQSPRVIVYDIIPQTPVVIRPDTVHAYSFLLGVEQKIQFTSVIVPHVSVQDLSIKIWISKVPYGTIEPPVWVEGCVKSLLMHPTPMKVADAALGIHFSDPYFIPLPSGLYFLNFHNRIGRANFYQFTSQEL